MAPVAARLSLGLAAAELGAAIEDWIKLPWPRVQATPGRVRGEVISLDTFGNVITNIRREDAEIPNTAAVHLAGATIRGVSRTYGDLPAGSLVALYGSGGLLEIAEVNGDAARRLNVARGAVVDVEL
jgi:S-adenosylmethionine hydrolase